MWTIRERYQNEPQFRQLVDMMTHHMMSCNFTPSEMREAAGLASIRYYEMRPAGIIVPADAMHRDLLKLEERYINTPLSGYRCAECGAAVRVGESCLCCGTIAGL
jgi:hypothetical protein